MTNSYDHITIQPNGDVLVVEIVSSTLNDFDLAHATAGEIQKAISGWHSDQVILSLENVQFVTSVGLILFARLVTFAKQSGTKLVLCGATQPIAKVLTTTRMVRRREEPTDQRLLLVDDVTAAKGAFA
jgi:anti-anti-sigma factor